MRFSKNVDVELASCTGAPFQRVNRLDGYPSFAEFITKYDAAIYRKYGHLSARNLLYLQSELHELEARLQTLDSEDAESIDRQNAEKTARNWKYFSDNQNDRAVKHRELQNIIKIKVREYHQALVLERQVLSWNQPDGRVLGNFRRWFTLTPAPVLWGRDEHLFDDANDLVSLTPPDADRLNAFLQKHIGWLFKERRCTDEVEHGRTKDIFFIPQRRIQRLGAVISVLFSAVLLAGAMVSLLMLKDQNINLRVGLIVLFTCLFAFVVGILTNARRAEIFGSTAAYAAVLVVFISGNSCSTNGKGTCPGA